MTYCIHPSRIHFKRISHSTRNACSVIGQSRLWACVETRDQLVEMSGGKDKIQLARRPKKLMACSPSLNTVTTKLLSSLAFFFFFFYLCKVTSQHDLSPLCLLTQTAKLSLPIFLQIAFITFLCKNGLSLCSLCT